ncbi:MAG: hypothetical protein WCP28_02505 [Actinomycetes bacterium]
MSADVAYLITTSADMIDLAFPFVNSFKRLTYRPHTAVLAAPPVVHVRVDLAAVALARLPARASNRLLLRTSILVCSSIGSGNPASKEIVHLPTCPSARSVASQID